MKFESNEVMKFHEQCHQSSVSDMNMESIKKENGDESGTGLGNQKGFMCPVCESNGTGPQLFSKWGPCSWHLWKEHRIDCELYTCSVCTVLHCKINYTFQSIILESFCTKNVLVCV